MFILITITISIGFAWLIVDQSNSTKSNYEQIAKPAWVELVAEFKTTALLFHRREQLEEYLDEIHEQFRNFETDYSFLVAFNSIKREVRERLEKNT